jgi:hypothetical protein
MEAILLFMTSSKTVTDWYRCVGIGTDGARAVIGTKKGVVQI